MNCDDEPDRSPRPFDLTALEALKSPGRIEIAASAQVRASPTAAPFS